MQPSPFLTISSLYFPVFFTIEEQSSKLDYPSVVEQMKVIEQAEMGNLQNISDERLENREVIYCMSNQRRQAQAISFFDSWLHGV